MARRTRSAPRAGVHRKRGPRLTLKSRWKSAGTGCAKPEAMSDARPKRLRTGEQTSVSACSRAGHRSASRSVALRTSAAPTRWVGRRKRPSRRERGEAFGGLPLLGSRGVGVTSDVACMQSKLRCGRQIARPELASCSVLALKRSCAMSANGSVVIHSSCANHLPKMARGE